MSETTQAPQSRQLTKAAVADPEKPIVFVPFGSADQIKLSIAIVQNMVAVPTKSGAKPTQTDAVRFMMLCQAQRLNPFAGDCFLTGYDTKNGPKFSMITAILALNKRAETSPEYEGTESGVILLNDDGTITEREGDFYLPTETVVGGWAKVYRKGRKPTYRRLAIEQRKPRYETDFWEGNKAAEQIVKCAEADALRATFPTLLGGLYIQGEHDGAGAKIVSEIVSRPIFEDRREDRRALPGRRGKGAPETTADEDEVPMNFSGAPEAPTTRAMEPQKEAPKAEGQPPVSEPRIQGAAEKVPEQNFVRAIRGLLKISNKTERALLEALRKRGLDESLGSLEEIAMAQPTWLKEVHDHWATVLKEIP